jgi:transposase-like protein
MSAFLPAFCPYSACAAAAGGRPLRFRRAGGYRRAADGRRVQRFRCLSCGRRFSSQSFRLDYRQQKPHVNVALFGCFVSKVSHRQTARILRVDRKTVHRRLRLFGPAMARWHEVFLRRARNRGGLTGSFSFDELETFEQDRRLRPLTVPVLIHRRSRFLVHFQIGHLPARGGLSPLDCARKAAGERRHGRRRSGSAAAVEDCLIRLKAVHSATAPLELVTDRKRSYPPLVRRHFARGGAYVREHSSAARNTRNPLFPINHALAMMRDHVSRLVRRSWCASKRADQLRHHLWIYTAWRNYVRPMFNRTPRISAASALGLADGRFPVARLLRWMWPEQMPERSI